MMALLPLRGWLGDAMAMQQMAPAMQAAAAAAPASAHAGHAAMPCHDTNETAAPAAGTDGEAGSHDSHGHGHCTACQICHSVAAGTNHAPPRPSAWRHAAPHTATPRFVSAEPRRLAEPPIS